MTGRSGPTPSPAAPNAIVDYIVRIACDYAGCRPSDVYSSGKGTSTVARVRGLVYSITREHPALSELSKREFALSLGKTAPWIGRIESSLPEWTGSAWWDRGIEYIRERIYIPDSDAREWDVARQLDYWLATQLESPEMTLVESSPLLAATYELDPEWADEPDDAAFYTVFHVPELQQLEFQDLAQETLRLAKTALWRVGRGITAHLLTPGIDNRQLPWLGDASTIIEGERLPRATVEGLHLHDCILQGTHAFYRGFGVLPALVVVPPAEHAQVAIWGRAADRVQTVGGDIQLITGGLPERTFLLAGSDFKVRLKVYIEPSSGFKALSKRDEHHEIRIQVRAKAPRGSFLTSRWRLQK